MGAFCIVFAYSRGADSSPAGIYIYVHIYIYIYIHREREREIESARSLHKKRGGLGLTRKL